MEVHETIRLDQKQKAALLALWNTEYPSQLAYPDINAFNEYLDSLLKPLHYLLMTNDSLIGGWAFTFERSSSRWFAIIINSNYQRKGYGSELLNKLKAENQVLHGWVTDRNDYLKADGSAYTSPLAFYLKNEFHLVADERFETDQLSTVKISHHRSN